MLTDKSELKRDLSYTSLQAGHLIFLSCALQNFSNSQICTASLNPFTVHALNNPKSFPVQAVPLPWGHGAGEAQLVPPSLLPAAAPGRHVGIPNSTEIKQLVFNSEVIKGQQNIHEIKQPSFLL